MAGKVMSGRYGTSRGTNYHPPVQGGKTCIIRHIWDARKWGFVARVLQHGPSYAVRAVCRWTAVPVTTCKPYPPNPRDHRKPRPCLMVRVYDAIKRGQAVYEWVS